MGLFSFITSDTNRSISCLDDDDDPSGLHPKFVVYLLRPNAESLREDDYEGYGLFGGKDAYAWLAQMNCPEECTGNDNFDRELGIDLFFGKEENNSTLQFPLKIVEHPVKYEDAKPSKHCPRQGFFYDDMDDNSYSDDKDCFYRGDCDFNDEDEDNV